MQKRFTVPTVLVVFGATGDLMARYIAPSLISLHRKNALPNKFSIVGIGRRDYTDDDFHHHLQEKMRALESISLKEDLSKFFEHVTYYKADFADLEGYAGLGTLLGKQDQSWSFCANKLFYLAVPPEHYESILTNLHDSNLAEGCSPEEGWTRVLIEKPFGSNYKTAEKLDMLLGTLFQEEQIYRIDHYLAKDVVQNILSFRFANMLFEPSFDCRYVEKIALNFCETLDVADRGAFFDSIGALRDVGATHLLQLLALVIMEQPRDYSADEIRTKRAEVLESLALAGETTTCTKRGQYKGYRDVKGVRDDSQTETYFEIRLRSALKRWHDTKIVLTGGKALEESNKAAIVQYQHPDTCLCPPGVGHVENQIRFNVSGDQSIDITFMVKNSSYDYTLSPRTVRQKVKNEDELARDISEYEQLMVDVMRGDQMRFVSTREVMAMWRIIDPIIESWEKGEVLMETY